MAVCESLLESGGGGVRGEDEGCAPRRALWGSLAHSLMLDSDTVDGGREKVGHRYGSSNVHVWGHIHDPPHCSGDQLGAVDDNHRGDDNSNRHGDSMGGKSYDVDFHHHGDGGGPVSAHFFACDSADLRSCDGKIVETPDPLDCGDLVGHLSVQLLSKWSCPVQWLCGCPCQLQECEWVSGEGSQWEHSDLCVCVCVCVCMCVID